MRKTEIKKIKTKYAKAVLRALVLLALLAAPVRAFGQINTDHVLNIGRNALYFEDYILSIQYFNQVIKIKPYLAEPYFYRAIAKISLDDYKGAEEDATLAIERNPFIVDAYQVRGVARQNLRNYKGAVADYDKGLEQMPEDKTFLQNKAVCEEELKQYDASDSTWHRLLKLDKGNEKAYFGLAQLELARKDTTKALEYVDKSIEISKVNANPYALRAHIESVFKKDYKAALADMNKAIELEPYYAGYFINRAFLKYNLDDYFGAMSDYNYAVDLDPTSLEGHYNRGLLLAEVGENNKAITDFSYVLKSDPTNFMALYNRAILYQKTGQHKLAIADFDAVLKKYPAFEAGYIARGEAKRQMGNTKGGEKDYNYALSLFKRKKTHVSHYDPAKIEAKAMQEKDKRAEAGEDVESESEIMNKFNTLLTVDTDNKIKPEYASKSRGHIQNQNVEITPEPLFFLSYYGDDNQLGDNTLYVREITDANNSNLLPMTLHMARGMANISEAEIKKQFSSIEYYNSVLAGESPRSIDYFARAMSFMMVKNAASALNDANKAIALSPKFALAYYLKGNAQFLQYELSEGENGGPAAKNSGERALSRKVHDAENAKLLDEIQASYDMVIKLAPKNVYAYYNKGNLYLLKEDYTSAINCYTQAIEIKPNFGEAYYNRGLVYLRMGNKKKGVADLSKAGELGILPSYNVLKRMNN